MDTRTKELVLKGIAEHRQEAEMLLSIPGDVSLVHRGRARLMLMKCPDGCGETVVINLDPRAGKAWRLVLRDSAMTLYPSVWRDTGCESHFILWRNRIVWCDGYYDEADEPSYDASLESRVLSSLTTDRYRSSDEIADELDEIWWDVLRVARKLVVIGKAISGWGEQRDTFKLKSSDEG